MTPEEIEEYFEDHRFVLECDQITESPEGIKYRLDTGLSSYEDYMFDHDRIEIKEIFPVENHVLNQPKYEDPGFLKRIQAIGETYTAFTFIVEVQK